MEKMPEWAERASENLRRLEKWPEMVKALRRLVEDLDDAERAIRGWQFRGGMGANIATEDKMRFPTIGSRVRHGAARKLLAGEPEEGG